MNGPAKVVVVIATFLLLSLVMVFAIREGRDRSGGASVHGVLHEVHISAMRFEPAVLDVRAGDTVVWVNDDFLPHTATSTSEAWDSGEIAPGASWKLVVGVDGGGDYLCTFHPMMTGQLTGSSADR